MGPLRLPSGDITDDSVKMAEVFLMGFSSVFSSTVTNTPAPNQLCFDNIQPITITPDLVQDMLNSLDPNSSMGDDAIHPRLLVNLSSVLAEPLSILFQSSLDSGVLPADWLCSTIVPIYKKASRYNPLNYRPISLTSVVCKTLERILVNKIMEYLEHNDILVKEQYGFRVGYSTTEQLLLTYDYVSKQLDSRNIVDLVFFDFEKAFDGDGSAWDETQR